MAITTVNGNASKALPTINDLKRGHAYRPAYEALFSEGMPIIIGTGGETFTSGGEYVVMGYDQYGGIWHTGHTQRGFVEVELTLTHRDL